MNLMGQILGLLLLVLIAMPALANEPIKIMAFGDSLTKGYGLSDPKNAFPVKLEAILKASGHNVQVINAGNSGDTTAAGLARVDWALFDKPDVVILELGANDMLRGLPVANARSNLTEIVDKFQAADLPILLTGMLATPSYGEEYKTAFDAIYPELAKEKNLILYPFFLDGVADDVTLNQADGIHPNAAGVEVIVDNILPYALQLIALAP